MHSVNMPNSLPYWKYSGKRILVELWLNEDGQVVSVGHFGN